MMLKVLLQFSLIFQFAFITLCQTEQHLTFPNNFKIGTASSAYQIEGGWNASGKGESVWDWFVHTYPDKIVNQDTGDVACDSFNKYKEDVQIAKDIGFDYYRVSISWTRILPNGFADKVSKEGLKYYRDLFDEMRSKNIQPVVTLYHWDHPEVLERMGGWMNELMVEWFADYARILFRELGDRMPIITTINEPQVYCIDAYSKDIKAPGKNLTGRGHYLCAHNMLKAHARAWHIYDDEFRAKLKGKIGLTLPCSFPFSRDPNDTLSTDIGYEFDCGWLANPIYSTTGDYPAVMKKRIAENSKFEGLPRSRLPRFSKKWLQYIKGTFDYFGLNYYTSTLVYPPPKTNNTIWLNDIGLVVTQDSRWPTAGSVWLKIVPEGLGNLLRIIKAKYNNPPVYILENGMSDAGSLADVERIEYLYSHMREVLIAANRDKCNIQRFTVWSLLDNFEWQAGYTERFGLVYIDFNDPNRTRRPKLSCNWLKEVIRSRKLISSTDYIRKSITVQL